PPLATTTRPNAERPPPTEAASLFVGASPPLSGAHGAVCPALVILRAMGSTRIREAFAFVQRPVPGDVAVYESGVVLALLTPFVSSVPVYRQWAWIALGPFLAGALGSAALAIRSSLRARTTVAAVVFAGVVILPLCLEVAWRSDGPPGTHVQSETIL